MLRISIGLCCVAVLPLAAVQLPSVFEVGTFSAMSPGGLPEGWEPLRFPSIEAQTRYSLQEAAGAVVLQADSRSSASALLTRVDVDPAEFPSLTWSWRAGDNCFVGSWREADLDDFPVRLFVLFEPSPGLLSFFRRAGQMDGDAIVYIPPPGTPKGGANNLTSHLSPRIRVLPVEQQVDPVSGWSRLARDVRADYIALFGREPRKVKGIAIMSDTDNSGTTCVSYFGDIAFSSTL